MVKSKVFIFRKHFEGYPKETDLELIEEELPSLNGGEFLAEAVFLSVDPYMRPYSKNWPVGKVFLGEQVAKVTESKNPDYPVGRYVVGNFGWRTHSISDGKDVFVLPDFEGLPLSLGLGILGMPGQTAYFGFSEICKPKAGETVVVSGAAGAVGSIVGQIAKIKGCKTVGIAGSDQKGKWIVGELGFNHFINYKTENIHQALSKAAPNGVDCYYDNVGGEISSTVLSHMNKYGRIAVGGSISSYNDEQPKVPSVQPLFISKELRMEGFVVQRWRDRKMECIKQHLQWIKDGKLKYHETITEGFENMFLAFVSMLKGGNTGKAIVKV